jgi:hypothetical protein
LESGRQPSIPKDFALHFGFPLIALVPIQARSGHGEKLSVHWSSAQGPQHLETFDPKTTANRFTRSGCALCQGIGPRLKLP